MAREWSGPLFFSYPKKPTYLSDMIMGRAGFEVSSKKTTQVQQNNALSKTTANTPQQEKVQNQVQILQSHPELEQIIKVWPELPEHIKAAIKALIQTNKQ